MSRSEKILVLLVLFTVLSLVMVFGAVVDVAQITRETRSELESERAKVARLESQLEAETKQNAERMTLLEAHVQFFISGGWK